MTDVVRIALAVLGKVLGTRGLGAELRSRIAVAVAEGPVEVDFAGVRFASESFLDEAFGRLTEEIPPALLREHCRIVNANDTILAMLRVAVRERRRLSEVQTRSAPPALAMH